MMELLRKANRYRKANVIPFLQMLFYNTICKYWVLLFGEKDKRQLPYRLSLCLIFKNEGHFLKEWLDYHLTIGVDHFYLYNNNSTDSFREIIAPYIEAGQVTLIEWPHDHAQFKAYEDCFIRFRDESKWISFIDADEFICPRKDSDINEWLERYSKWHAINIHWLMFGTGGQLNHDYCKNVIEQYFSCWDDLYIHGKTIVNTRFDIANFDTWYPHHHTYMYRRIFGIKMVVPAVNQWGYICPHDHTWGGGRLKLHNASIQINHYFTKAWDIYSAKMHKTDVLFEKNPKADYKYFYRYEDKCVSKDYTIQRFFIRMKIFQKLIR